MSDERLGAEEKKGMAAKWPQLDEILKQRKNLQTEIRALMDKVEELRKKDQELDERFHRLALSLTPSVVKRVGEHKRPGVASQADLMVKEILKAMEKGGPSVEEQIRAITGKYL